MKAKGKHLRTLVCGEELRHFDFLSDEMESANPLTVEAIILEWGAYFPLLICYWKKWVMHNRMRNPRRLKVIGYTTCLIEINYYLALLPGGKLTEKLVWRSQIKLCWIVWPIVGARKRMCRGLTTNLLLKKRLLICLSILRLLNLSAKV